jgi:hypothetical protein
MTPYNRFINKKYIRLFNHYLKSVCEPLFYEKYKKKVELKLYGIVIRRKNSIYDGIPKEELLDSQAQVMFIIDTEPRINRTNFFEELIIDRGKYILQLKNGNEFGYDPEKFYLKVNFNNRPLFPLDYVADENSINENNLPFLQKEKNGIKRRTFNEKIDSEELKWHFDDNDRKVKIIESNGWQFQMDNDIPKKLKKGDTLFIPKGTYHRVIKGNGDLVVEIKEINNEVISEERFGLREEVRKVVRDIITTFKSNKEGEFYLPEEINDDLVYHFPRIGTPFSVELQIDIDESLEDYSLNATYWGDDDTISVRIKYNPKMKTTLLYDLVGDLNETLAHEIRHIVQRQTGSYDLDVEEPENPFEYYSQPHEIDAQIFGFNRLAKLSKKPFETVIRNWYKRNKDIHKLTDDETEEIINMILNN